MAWSLEIHHIDVQQGDSTLIIAREVVPLIGALPIVRSVLIDGGRQNKAADVHAFITARVPTLDVIIVTHYDADHYNGIAALLTGYNGPYNNTLIFDQGWPQAMEAAYITYLKAINGRNNNALAAVFGGIPPARPRVTNRVISYGGPLGAHQFLALNNLAPIAVPAGAPGTINVGSNWLVDEEVMWTNAAGAPNNALHGNGAAPGAAGGPPSMTCIAANAHILQVGGGTVPKPNGINDEQQKNARSLAFMVQLEGFRYYIGGDVSSFQEDGHDGIGAYLASIGGVTSMKASHHGSDESTSANFVGQLNPQTAFISCGCGNGFLHPRQSVLNILDAHANLDDYYITQDRGNDDFCTRINLGIGLAPLAYTPKGVVAGGWGPILAVPAAPANPSPCGGSWPNDGALGPIPGHISIEVIAANLPNYDVSFRKPDIDMPHLTAQLQLPPGVVWPNATPLTVGTILPAATVWPGGIGAPMQGMAINQAYTLPGNFPWPNNQTVDAGVIMPGIINLGNAIIPNAVTLPQGVFWANGVQLPVGTILPDNTIIPPGIVSPTPPGLEEGDVLEANVVLPAGVFWPNGEVLPYDTVLPANTVFPVNAIWPANTPLPQLLLPNGSNIGAGAILPVGFSFPAGTQWANNAALPELIITGNTGWPAGLALPGGTLIPQNTQLPAGILWPAGVAIPGAGQVTLITNY
jgi:beta-lactamase superfamily II metal-dependent hydrolase